MKIENGKMYIIQDGEEKEVELTLDQKLHIKLGYTCFYDYEKESVETSTPEGVNFEEEKTKYIERRTLSIKDKYQKIIFEKYSLTKQLNMGQEAQMISVIAQFEKRDISEAEGMRLTEIMQAKEWIDSKRLECTEEISTLSE